ncbi:MAG TPA: type I pullulanase, partial [Deinococcales bacterium]|nr:type I pullulanase [Deinococcales bacterium]
VVDVTLGRAITPEEVSQPILLKVGNQPVMTVYAREALSERPYWYSGNDLGPTYSRASTTFKVWSPPSSSAEVVLYDAATGGPSDTIDMQRGPNGSWSATVRGDLHGKYFQYRFRSYGEARLAADIYGYAASEDGTRSMVVDLSRTNPTPFVALNNPAGFKPTDAIIYEMMVRDFTIDPSSGVRPEWRGKYLGVTQTGTTVPGSNYPTGLDYLKRLGVTDVHLLPIQKFNPANQAAYNWGYETTLFNVPDARYSTTPQDPVNTIREVKTMISGLHAAGIRVILDVVYNHTVPIAGDQSAFDSTVPYYYFRTNDEGKLLNESGVGNALHDERPMARKYVRDSTSYWVREYKIDGFRFDLLGMFTKATVVNVAEALRKIRPDLVIYGEPWTGGGPTRFGKGAQRGTNVAVFNDDLRNAIRGDLDGTRLGFATGGSVSLATIQKGVVGNINFAGAISGFTDHPAETVNYVSAHDNLALWDKYRKSLPNASEAQIAAAIKLSNAIVLTSQGIPFLEGGVEMGRTKGGNHNSYNAGDEVNRFDWASAPKFQAVTDYYAGLIALRKAHPAFRLADAASVKASLQFLPAENLPAGVVAFTLDGSKSKDSWSRILVAYNGGTGAADLRLPAGTWTVVVHGEKAGTASLGTASGTLRLTPTSAFVLYQR